MKNKLIGIWAGLTAGIINGLFGAGGGLVLVPILSTDHDLQPEQIFSSSIVIILPICISSLIANSGGHLPWINAWPYLMGGTCGGILAGLIGHRIPTTWLHRFLGILILYGGIRYLC